MPGDPETAAACHGGREPAVQPRPLARRERDGSFGFGARDSMAPSPTVCVQMGHVPRTTGATGTRWEQQAAREIAGRLVGPLAALGVRVMVIGADDPVPHSDVFVALHCDGSVNPDRRGASVGYPDVAGGLAAQAWKRRHSGIYPGGWLPDNYTPALRSYYGFRRSTAPHRYLAEHCTTTNDADLAWLQGHLDAVAAAHVAALCEVLAITPPKEDEVPLYTVQATGRADLWVTNLVARWPIPTMEVHDELHSRGLVAGHLTLSADLVDAIPVIGTTAPAPGGASADAVAHEMGRRLLRAV